MSGSEDSGGAIVTHYLGGNLYVDVKKTNDPKDIIYVRAHTKPQEPNRPILQRLKDYFKK